MYFNEKIACQLFVYITTNFDFFFFNFKKKEK